MNKMYQAVRDFVSPFTYTVTNDSRTIVGSFHETLFSSSVKVCCALTSEIEKRGWEEVYHGDGEIKNMVERNIYREYVEPQLFCKLLVKSIDWGSDGYFDDITLDSKHTIFIRIKLEDIDNYITLMALDLATLQTHIVNKVSN